ncbi:hypothetical protein HM1_0188 [Heliomicrobium modesticaldum Ice1]|uniref:Uncharacterized protein n=1 Tax=Heliobacterium modesticaldum (strain ATCC 51547 / Ice1) TaxID=498761 RepID=B0TDU4_HELMI|nr:hypothetical protein HM1_0188 [Heliomicrobium modesticaldum Ice1]
MFHRLGRKYRPYLLVELNECRGVDVNPFCSLQFIFYKEH